jgi:Tol biopolymer transport system component
MRAELGSFIDLFTVSASGILVFRAGSADRQLAWVDRHGGVLGNVGPPGLILSVALSPDDREAAISTRSAETGTFSSSLIDLTRGVVSPFLESAAMPVWTPDGRSLIYRHEGKTYQIRKRSAHGDPADADLGVVDSFATPHSLSPDGGYVLYTRMGGNFDIGVKDLRGGPAQMLLRSEYDERTPSFSPDGKWFVYSSDEAGQTEIFVRRFPLTQEQWRVSTSGGQQPQWGRNGREIYFVSLDGHFMAVPVTAGAAFSAGEPEALFQTSVRLNTVFRHYASSADGQRFLMVIPLNSYDSDYFRVIVNW